MLKQGEVLTLSDNKKYTVISTIEMDNNYYSYLIDNDDYSNMMFCKFVEDDIEEITDHDLIEKLLIKFKNNLDSEMY
ncbi:MAG: hypothetical protein IIZ67_06105 [Bacilli bacterium]|jgi:hypothetical protein|nr:hypothetical protein [Bacilli bacterium]